MPRRLSRRIVLKMSVLEELGQQIKGGSRLICISGLASISAKAYVLSKLRASTAMRFAVVTGSIGEMESWAGDIELFLADQDCPKTEVLTFPAFETDPYSGISPHAETLERRAMALWQLSRGLGEMVIMPARSLIQKTYSSQTLFELGSELSVGSEFPPEQFISRLVTCGFVREDPLFGPGQFSMRGGIVDVWPPNSDMPFRIEFFGDTVDSIRSFDVETQLSIDRMNNAAVAPMSEISVSAQDMKDWAFFARERFSNESFRRNLKDRTDLADDGETFSGWEFLLPLVKPMTSSTFDHIDDFVLVIDEPSVIEAALSQFYEHVDRSYSSSVELGMPGLLPSELYLTPVELRECLGRQHKLELRALGRGAAATDEDFILGNRDANGNVSTTQSIGKVETPSTTHIALTGKPLFLFPTAESALEIEIQSRSTRKFHGDIRAFVELIDGQTKVAVETTGMAERLAEMLRDHDIYLPLDSIRIGSLSSGFELPSDELVTYTETDIFGDVTAEGPRTSAPGHRPKSRLGAFISDFRDLKPGDHVVHVDHGIGRFDGLQTISSQGSEREFVLLIYADEAKLFVPVERMDLISRHSSGEAASATLDRLGGLGWQKTKAKAKRAMRDMADELLKLYAERKLVRGHAFPPDAPWQHEFEDAFPYELTADQVSAIKDVKSDMETPTPMDRLIIGDVGYGKTEVAMRAAFKAVMDGKQVAILAPTTILAYQHFESFTKRFGAFPAKVELLSRFRSASDQKAVALGAGEGSVDVLIGTHRILSTDVTLPKLGLVVVDEEQRFGVGHKEKLKHLKKKVDVLTLSATPIPRTLNMSLLGMRDMSVIETPPRDRLAINTQVVQFSEGVIRSAVELELGRGGQVFFIHNRVESIEAIAALIKKIVPSARIAIGHGQMNEKEMEQVMLDFIDYKYDVLVATTIIENGIDIPRANTIIINRSDNYGLSQLYQLRGRVGRSNRRAYAYLLIPSELELTPIARRRLTAIREFSDLGAGFRLAALDLELRGAGNLLGGQQSGHLDALGFDLYTKMLERTIAEIRGDDIADETSVSINLGTDVSIPKDYIIEAAQRLRTYKRISSAETDDELIRIRVELEDRYGRLPRSVERLFEYGRLRKMAERLAIISIDRTGDGIAIKLGENSKVSPERLTRFLEENEGAAFSPTGIFRVRSDDRDPIALAIFALEAVKS